MKTETPEEIIARLTKDNESLSKKNTGLAEANEAGKTKIADLTAKITELTQSNDALIIQINNATGEIEVLTGKISDLQSLYDQLVEESSAEIERLSLELTKAKAIADVAEPTFTLGNEDYLIVGKRFTWRGTEYTTEDLLKDETLQRTLLKAKVGFIQKK